MTTARSICQHKQQASSASSFLLAVNRSKNVYVISVIMLSENVSIKDGEYTKTVYSLVSVNCWDLIGKL